MGMRKPFQGAKENTGIHYIYGGKKQRKRKNESKRKIVRFPTKCSAIIHILNIIWYHVVAKVLLKPNSLKCQTKEFRLQLKRLGSKSQILNKG